MSKPLTTEQFITRSISIHGDKYDYSKTNYIDSKHKVLIICKKHGEFWQNPFTHLRGAGCPLCNSKRKISQDELIKRFNKKHNNRYNYNDVHYKNMWSPVDIICNIHGRFSMLPCNHLKGQNCPKCAKIKCDNDKFLSQDEILVRFRNVHGNRYNYSKVEYKGIEEKVCIICEKHGEFWQSPHNHLDGCGCPRCRSSKLENKIYNFLLHEGIDFVYQYFPGFLSNKKSHMSLDFYIPKYNIAIECQGGQHYKSVEHFGGEHAYKNRRFRDMFKLNECLKHNIKILYFAEKKYSEEVYDNLNDLKNELFRNFNEFEKIQ